ncbi:MAG TPA: ferritin-like domain-containing protein [Gemmatimonadales bacterium]|nr:ferritin-like domain-containing protein [Gemmatimonadales bacterium]
MSDGGTRHIVFDPAALQTVHARRTFLSRLAMAAGATALSPLIMKGYGINEMLAAQAAACNTSEDVNLTDTDILNYALTLEYLESTYYLRAVGTASLPTGATVAGIDPDGSGAPGTVPGLSTTTPPAPASFDVVTFVTAVRDHEISHVLGLQAALSANALARSGFSFDFKNSYDSAANFLSTAVVLEDTGVSAYLGQAGNIDDTAILATAGSILGVEAEHASTFRLLTSQTVTPDNAAFDTPMSSAEVLAAVQATGFITAAPQLPFPK